MAATGVGDRAIVGDVVVGTTLPVGVWGAAVIVAPVGVGVAGSAAAAATMSAAEMLPSPFLSTPGQEVESAKIADTTAATRAPRVGPSHGKPLAALAAADSAHSAVRLNRATRSAACPGARLLGTQVP